ncbi:MAG: DUF4124 domain-containing protein, partial [Methylophilus sp.]|nr:DUF4124 domain-containing protein [Methylophilus sp.]
MNITRYTQVTLSSLLLVALSSFSNTSIADVYRWRDSKGVMQYSDRPPPTAKSKQSETILLNIIKNDSLCANPELTKQSVNDNNPVALNFLFKRVSSDVAKQLANIKLSSTQRNNRWFSPIRVANNSTGSTTTPVVTTPVVTTPVVTTPVVTTPVVTTPVVTTPVVTTPVVTTP